MWRWGVTSLGSFKSNSLSAAAASYLRGTPNAASLERSVWGAGLRRLDVQVDSSVTVFGDSFRTQPLQTDAHLGGIHRVSVQQIPR